MTILQRLSELQPRADWGRTTGREFFLLTLAGTFVLTNAISLSVVTDGNVSWSHLYGFFIWAVLMGIAFFSISYFRPNHDIYLLPIIGLLSGWGLVLLDRLAPNFLQRQIIWLAIGMAALIVAAQFPRDLTILRRYRYTWLIAGLILLAATLVFGVNPSGQGATLWLKVPFWGSVYFQPSELLKLLLVVFLASYFDERRRLFLLQPRGGLRRWLAFLAPLVLMWGFCIVLLVWQRDLGAATLFLAVFIALLYLATGEYLYVFGGLALLVLAGLLGYFAFDVVALRIDTWVNPWPEADSRGFQIIQSLYALAAGGISGQGVGLGYPDYIPVVHSDFAFAAITEDWGLIGGIATLVCFAFIAYRGMLIASKSAVPFNLFLAAGITMIISTQAFLIMAGVTKLLPLTGVTLPYVSYGGSSLLISCVMIGLLLNISSRSR